jgi:hypothetical protein
MKMIALLVFSVVQMGCSKSAPTETVESLAANPERLKVLREECKEDRARMGDELCKRVAEATNRRFLGDGKTPYTPPKEEPKF